MSDSANIISLNFDKYVEPSYSEKANNRGWVDYGSDNLFPQYLIDLYNSSPVHNALCNSIGSMAFGGGVVASKAEAKLQIEKWGLNEELQRAAMDLKVQGGYYLEVKFSLDRTYIKSLRHIPFEEIRAGAMNSEGKIEFFYHCLDWENTQKSAVTPIKSYCPDEKNEYPVQLLSCGQFSLGSRSYFRPDYMGGINWIEVDKQVSIFHNNNIASGMSPSFFISWKNGIPPKNERAEIRRDVEKQLVGPTNSGKFFMTFSDGGDQSPEFEPFPLSDAHNQYQFVSTESTDKIMISHRVTSPSLFGVKTAGQLGTTDELKTSAKLFQANVIQPMQQIITDCAEMLLAENGIYDHLVIEGKNPILAQNDLDLNAALTVIERVKNGQLTADQAANLFASVLNYPSELIGNLLGVEVAKLSKQTPFLSDSEGEDFFNYLDSKGEKIDGEEWDLLREEQIEDPSLEHELHQSEVEKLELFKSYAKPGAKSEIDTGLYKIRYRYSRNLSENSRAFCIKMVGASKANTVYKYEDIIDMGNAGVNGQFAEKGKNSYNLFLYKGGVECHHVWSRLVYFRKRSTTGQFLPNEGLKNDKRVSNKADIPKKDVSKGLKTAQTAPRDMPNGGRVN